MTTVSFYSRNSKLTGFKATGHAGNTPAGENIICAAVSALTQTAYIGLKEVGSIPVMFDTADAYFEVRLCPELDAIQSEKAQLLLETLRQGLKAIEREYPKEVRIITKERR